MATIATTSHQKEINVKICFFLSQQFKRGFFSGTFSLHLTFFARKINNNRDTQSLIWRLAASRAVRSIELDIYGLASRLAATILNAALIAYGLGEGM